MLTIALVLFLYYAISIAAGVLGLRGQSASRYITAPNNTGWLALTLTLIATVVGGGMFLGISQLGFEQGLAAFTLGASYLIGSIILGLIAAPIRRFVRENNVITLFGAIDVWYPKQFTWLPALSTILAFASFGVFILMLAAQFVAVGTYIDLYTKLNFNGSILWGAAAIAFISTLLYAAVGGFKRDVITDVVQMLFIFAGVGIIIVAITREDFVAKMGTLPPELFYGQSGSIIFFVGSILFVAPTFLVRFDLWQRIITARSDGQAKAAFFISGVVNFLMFAVFGIIGLYARADGVTESTYAGLAVIQRVVNNPALAGLAVAAFFAAVISTADTFLGVAGISVARCVLYKKGELEQPDTGDVSVRHLRLITAIIGILSIGLALIFRNIVDIFAAAFGLLIVFLPSILGGFFRKGATQHECYWSIFVGLLFIIPLTFIIPREAFLPGLIVSAVTYGIVAWIQRRRTKSGKAEVETPTQNVAS